MAFEKLSDREKLAVKEAIVGVLISPDIGATELQTLHGVSFERVKKILRTWPHFDDSGWETENIINGFLSDVAEGNFFSDDDVAYGVGLSKQDWPKWFSFSRDEMNRVLERWRALKDEEE